MGVLAVGCSTARSAPDPLALVGPSRKPMDTSDAGFVVDTPGDCGADFCGDKFLTERRDPPNLYFLVDRSGSMAEIPPHATRTKYDQARTVIKDVLRVVATRVRFGAAIFPASAEPEECSEAFEVVAPTLTDPPLCPGDLDTDPLTTPFGSFKPAGNTPTSAALAGLAPELEALDGKTYLVLITDGAPNCNPDAECTSQDCMRNLQGDTIAGQHCVPGGVNCCDPDIFGEEAPKSCVDVTASERAIEELAEHGVATYVIGMPGAEPFEDVLDRLAAAGGTARASGTSYYAVADQDELEDALSSIATGLAIRCSIDLDEPPDDATRVNVYFDGTLVPADPDDGWSWDGDQRIIVNGAACADLESGSVADARAVFGCGTVVR
jgi:hypothetical protein